MTPTQFYHATEQARPIFQARARVRARLVDVSEDGDYHNCDLCSETWVNDTHKPMSQWRKFYMDTLDVACGMIVCSLCLDEYVAEEASDIVGAAASGRLLDGVEHLDAPAGVVVK